MSEGTLTIQLTTDELKKLIRDELSDVVTREQLDTALGNRPTLRDVNDLIKSEIDRSFDSLVAAVQSIRDGWQGLDDRWSKMERQLAVLVEQSKNLNESVRDVKDEQKRIDDEQDEIKRGIAHLEQTMLTQGGKIESQERAIFGDPSRQGVGSLFDHVSTLGKTLAEQIGLQTQTTQKALQKISNELAPLRDDISQLKAASEENTRFRLRRQHIEQIFIQAIPNTAKRLAGKLTKEMVVTAATRAGLAGASLFLLWLLGQMQ